MKAISIQQPYASLVVLGLRDVDNRNWPTDYRGKVLIHAPMKSAFVNNFVKNFPDGWWVNQPTHIKDAILTMAQHTSAIVGYVTLSDCTLDHSSEWAIGGFHKFVFEEPVIFEEPILTIGNTRIWDYENTEELTKRGL